MVRLILKIPRLLINVLLGLVFEIVKMSFILALIFLGFLYWQSQSREDFSQRVSFVVRETSRLVQNGDDELTRPFSERSRYLQTDAHEENGAHWPKPEAKVYIGTSTDIFVKAYDQAIINWNKTKTFSFKKVSSEKEADIILKDYSDGDSLAAGGAETEVNLLTKDLIKATVYLNSFYLLDDFYAYDFERIVHTAEHELGHAIGLSHNDSDISLMQSSGSFHGIQAVDIQAVKELYDLK